MPAGNAARENQHRCKQRGKTHPGFTQSGNFLLQSVKASILVWFCQLIKLLVCLLKKRKREEKKKSFLGAFENIAAKCFGTSETKPITSEIPG